jgi:putative pyoverdin transport system ATP-binding/permease protein
MNLIRFFFRGSRTMMAWTLAAAVLSGACNVGLMSMVTRVLGQTGTPLEWMLWAFLGMAAGRLITNFGAQLLLAHYSQQNCVNLRRDLVSKILAVPLRQLEEIGAPRLMVALTEDVLTLTEAMLIIPTFTVNIAILLCGAVYLAWLSWTVLLAMGGFILLGAIGYRILIRAGFKRLFLARDEQDRLYKHFRELTEGMKELKLHRERRGAFFAENIRGCTERYRKHAVGAEMRFIIAHNWRDFLFFTVVGAILFYLPKAHHVTPQAMTGYVVAMLYMMGPLSGVLSSLSLFGRASAALAKVEELGVSLAARAGEERVVESGERITAFEKIELVDIKHMYWREKEDESFTLGPIRLSFVPGQVTYLVGGNGSGKSSLAKVITGLYPPKAGTIRLDGRTIDDSNRDDYRQLFSAVFADYYLFDNLLGTPSPELDAQAREYLNLLHLQHKVKVKDGILSTTALSSGQRKRLALLNAYLEDRPFYLFDEWASDQDPLFKDIFYTQLLPDLKARNKAVLVITHDDRYFHLADRIVKLDYGQIETRSVGSSSPFPPAEILARAPAMAAVK